MKIIVDKIFYKPSTKAEKFEIYGQSFYGWKNSPNVYVIETIDDISKCKNIEFDYEGLKYYLKDITEHPNTTEGLKTIECRNWSEVIKNI